MKELPKRNVIQFLDMFLSFEQKHVCWQYSPRASKPLLNFHSKHLKVVKNGIALSCLKSALSTLCAHGLTISFNAQVDRLLEAGYPRLAIATVAERLTKSISTGTNAVAVSNINKKRVVSIPYIHTVSQRLKKVGSRYGVNVVFTAPNKLGRVCAAVHRGNELMEGNGRTDICQVKHTANNSFTDCHMGVVYKIPFSCGRFYVGQTTRSIHQGLIEHRRSPSGGTPSNLPLHCQVCNCTPEIGETEILY